METPEAIEQSTNKQAHHTPDNPFPGSLSPDVIMHQIFSFLDLVVVVDPSQRSEIWNYFFPESAHPPPLPDPVVLHIGLKCALSEVTGQPSYREAFNDYLFDDQEYQWLQDLFQDYPCREDRLERLSARSLFGRFIGDPLHHVWFLFRSLDLSHVTGHSFCTDPLLRSLVFDPKTLRRLNFHHRPGIRSGVSSRFLTQSWRDMDCDSAEAGDRRSSRCQSKAAGPNIRFVPLPQLTDLTVVLDYPAKRNQLPNLLMKKGYLRSPLRKILVAVGWQDERGDFERGINRNSQIEPVVVVSSRKLDLEMLSRSQMASFLSSPFCGTDVETLIVSSWHHLLGCFSKRHKPLWAPPKREFLDSLQNLRCFSCSTTIINTGFGEDLQIEALPLVESVLNLEAVRATIELIDVSLMNDVIPSRVVGPALQVSVGGVFPSLECLLLHGCEFLSDFQSPRLEELTLVDLNLFAAITSSNLELMTWKRVTIPDDFRSFTADGTFEKLSVLLAEVGGNVEDRSFRRTCCGLKDLFVFFETEFFFSFETEVFPTLERLYICLGRLPIPRDFFENESKSPVLTFLALTGIEVSQIGSFHLPNLETLVVNARREKKALPFLLAVSMRNGKGVVMEEEEEGGEVENAANGVGFMTEAYNQASKISVCVPSLKSLFCFESRGKENFLKYFLGQVLFGFFASGFVSQHHLEHEDGGKEMLATSSLFTGTTSVQFGVDASDYCRIDSPRLTQQVLWHWETFEWDPETKTLSANLAGLLRLVGLKTKRETTFLRLFENSPRFLRSLQGVLSMEIVALLRAGIKTCPDGKITRIDESLLEKKSQSDDDQS